MKYIKYWDVFNSRLLDGYLIREDDLHFYVCDPLCYDWLLLMKRDIPETALRILDKQLYNSLVDARPMYSYDSWIFNFGVKEEDIKSLISICSFFESFLYYKHHPFCKKLEVAFDQTKKFIPEELMIRLLSFVLSQFPDDPDRVRIALSGKINKYISRIENSPK